MTKRIKILISLSLISLILRFVLGFQVYSGDLNNHMTWAAQMLDTTSAMAYTQEYPGVMQPTYPPISLLNFISSEFVYRQVKYSADYLNTHVSLFPSKLIWAMEDSDFRPAFYKILNLITDLGIGILIFRFTRSNLLSAMFTLNPAVWYLTTLWGQIDYQPIFFFLLAIHHRSHFWFAFTWLIKQTAILFMPIFVIFSYKYLGLKKTLVGIIIQLLLFSVSYSLFLANPVTTYLDRLNTGSGSVWINDNAFNFWVFVSQMQKIPDGSYRILSLTIFIIFLITLFNKFIRNISIQNIYWISLLTSAGAFFILTRMHERYFAPALPFLLLLSYKNEKILFIYLLSSIIHLLNLYHWWWYPNLPWLYGLMSSITTIYLLSFIFILIFLYSYYEYLRQPTE